MNNKFIFSEIDTSDKNTLNSYDKCGRLCFKIEIAIDIYLRNHSDVALEYLEIAFAAQKLSEISEIIKVYETPKVNLYPHVVLITVTEKPYEMKNMLKWFSMYFSGEFGSDEDEIEAREEFADFEDKIYNYSICPILPHYCDLYFANFIASYYDWNAETIKKTLALHPEWRFFAWKSTWSRKLGFDLFISGEFWLLDISSDLSCALMDASDYKIPFSKEKFTKPVRVITDMGKIYILMQDEVLCISLGLHFYIARCAEVVFPFEEDMFLNTGFDWGVSANFYISNDSSLVVFKGGTYQYVLFYESIEVLETNQIDKLASSIQDITADLLERGSNSIKVKCNWSLINDEIFEQLCYDLVLRDGKFIPEETRKMGLSKSRDGGRDIVTTFKTYSGHNKNRFWVIQCKFSKSKKSLGRNDVKLSDLIDEYSPAGVIIATNMFIDAGAYDKFDKISKNRGTDIKYWDGLGIERLLNRNPDLIRSYKLESHD